MFHEMFTEILEEVGVKGVGVVVGGMKRQKRNDPLILLF